MNEELRVYKTFFCSFGDSRLSTTLKRIGSQARQMKAYDNIFLYNERDIDEAFRHKFKNKLSPIHRGFGYWCWKPQVILQTLERIDDGDIMQYCDAGCHLNPDGRKRLLEYFDIAANSKSGILLFRDPTVWDYQYTKGDLFNYLKVIDNKAITHTNQFAGGIWFIRKEEATINFIKSCIAVFEADFSLIDDSASKIPNFEGFIDHRHDQSISSILAKQIGVEELSSNEFYTTGDWSELKDYPIWTKRDKNFGFIHQLKKAVYPLYKLIFK